MPVDLSKFFVIGISSRALFDLSTEDRIFKGQGLKAFSAYQLEHEDDVLPSDRQTIRTSNPQKSFRVCGMMTTFKMELQPRDPHRIDPMVDALRRLWKRYPDMRLGQLVINAAHPSDTYNIEDDVMLQKLNEMFGSDLGT